ncbi:MAG: type IV pilus secretin PilQ family protein [Methylotetracoccus sp.]
MLEYRGAGASDHRAALWRRLAVVCVIVLGIAQAEGATLKSIDFASSGAGSLQFEMTFDGPFARPRIFETENPSRLALDFPGVRNGLAQRLIPVRLQGAESIQTIESGGRTRVILNLGSMMPYTSNVEGNRFLLTLQTGRGRDFADRPGVQSPLPVRPGAPRPQGMTTSYGEARGGGAARIDSIDFRRGDRGEGRVLVSLSNPQALVDVRAEGQRVVVNLPGTAVPAQLAKRYDVLDFATPVRSFEATTAADGNGARLVIMPGTTDYEYSSYQTDNLLTVEFRPLTRAERDDANKKRGLKYSGEKLSLNFQDIPVRSVLQILADFTNLNIVASDSVQGNLTLRLNEVPWDQALDLVLKSKGLAKRQEGNIIRVAPTDEINRIEKEELEAQKVVEELEPLKTEIIQINYTKAEDVKTVLVGTTESTGAGSVPPPLSDGPFPTKNLATSEVSQSILSGRGNVTVDPRTNQLIVKDTARNLERIRDLIRQLDKAVQQVLIEARIVIAENSFLRELGARLGLNRQVNGRPQTALGYLVPTEGVQPFNYQNVPPPPSSTYGDVLVDLAATAASASGGYAGFTLLKAGDYLLDLELSAAQRNRRSEVLSNPRLITADQTKATIKQGVELPYQITQAASTGGGLPVQNISFKEAVLELNVTPHITPDQSILMDLLVKKDTRGEAVGSNFAIDKREIQTTAQVNNGETVVLGGVFEDESINQTDKVPFFGDLPGVGYFFRRDLVQDNKRELLIFITPKVLQPSVAAVR